METEYPGLSLGANVSDETKLSLPHLSVPPPMAHCTGITSSSIMPKVEVKSEPANSPTAPVEDLDLDHDLDSDDEDEDEDDDMDVALGANGLVGQPADVGGALAVSAASSQGQLAAAVATATGHHAPGQTGIGYLIKQEPGSPLKVRELGCILNRNAKYRVQIGGGMKCTG